MMKSAQARKQRKARKNAPMHEKQHFVHAHVSKELKGRLNIKKRSVRIASGDSVKVIKGKYKGKTGKVVKVDLTKAFIYLDSIKIKNARGKEHNVPVRCNNVYITDLNMADKRRESRIIAK